MTGNKACAHLGHAAQFDKGLVQSSGEGHLWIGVPAMYCLGPFLQG